MNVLGHSTTVKGLTSQATTIDQFDKKIFQHFRVDLSEKDITNATLEIEESLKELTKSSILELRALAKPHALVEKVL